MASQPLTSHLKSSRTAPFINYSPSSNNPQSESPSSILYNRSVSPNGFQLYKQCIDQIHQQPKLTQIKSQVKIQSPRQIVKHQKITRISREEEEQEIKRSGCSIDDRLEQGRESVFSNHIQQLIDHTIKTYQDKLKQIEDKYQGEIESLENKLKLLESNISAKQNQVQQIKSFYQNKLEQQKLSTLESRYQPILENRIQYNMMKQTLDGLTKQCKDIERKIKIIVDFKNRQIDQMLIKRVEDKIQRVQKQVIINYGNRVRNATKQIFDFVNKYQFKVQQLQNKSAKTFSQTTRYDVKTKTTSTSKLNCQQNENTSFVGINVKIVQIKQQLISSQLQLKSIPDIFKMYNTQYQLLFAKIKNALITIQSKNPLQQSIMIESQQVNEQSPDQSVNSSLVSPVHLKLQSQISSPKHQIKPISLFKSSYFNNHSVKTSRQILSSRNISDVNKLERLIETFSLLGHKLPMRCSIDQTGCLKYSDSGTYIFDKSGNIFELNKEELEVAKEMKLLVML